MRAEEKKLARKLRKQGWSMNEIYRKLGVSKGTVSVWLRDIKLTKAQKQKLSQKGIKKEVIERRRLTRLSNENARRQIIIDNAERNIHQLSKKDLFLIGVTLYWAEGSKTKRGVVQFSNSDPNAVQLMMRFFKDICGISNKKFRGHIHIHPHLDTKRAEHYWSSISGIPPAQFYKTYQKTNKASKNKKDTLLFGTFNIIICDTELFLKIYGWIKGICKQFKNNSS